MCVLETPNIASSFFVAVSARGIGMSGLFVHRMGLSCGCDDFLNDGTAVFACALLGGSKHCFGCFAIDAHVFFGFRGPLRHGVALSCWWDVVGVDVGGRV